MVIAGALIAPRSGLDAPPALAPVATSPVSDFSVMSFGMAREMSLRVRSQSKREPAMSLTVCTRDLAIASKSAYGLSCAAWRATACWRAVTWARSASRCLMVLLIRTWPATPATQAASTPRTTNAPAPPVASGLAPSSADALEAPRVSGGRRLTALIAPDIGTPHNRLEPAGARTLRKAVEVPVDDVVAREQADETAEGQPGAERDALLAALLHAVARHHAHPDNRAGNQRGEDRGRDGPAEEEPEHAGELDVPDPHPGGIDERGDQEEAAGRERRDQVLGQRVRIEGEHEHDRRDGPDRRQHVRD